MLKRIIHEEVISRLFSNIPLSLLGKLILPNLIIPYYHMVSNSRVSHVVHLYKYKNVEQFKHDLDFLLKDYYPVGLVDLLDNLKEGRILQRKSMLLTFDDGFSEMYDVVMPILLNKGIPATFFINSAFIDNKELCYLNKASILAEQFDGSKSLKDENRIKQLFFSHTMSACDVRSGLLSIKYKDRAILDKIAELINIDFNDYLIRNKPYLTTNQIRYLLENGFTIGAHSIDHPLYSALPIQDQLHQTIESVKYIREKFLLNYGVFAFPLSDSKVSSNFFVELFNTDIVDLSFGNAGMIDDSFMLNYQRFSLEKPLLPAERIMAIHSARRVFRCMKGSSTILRT